MLPKLCHLDNDLVIIIIILQCIYCVVHMTHILKPHLTLKPLNAPRPLALVPCRSSHHGTRHARPTHSTSPSSSTRLGHTNAPSRTVPSRSEPHNCALPTTTDHTTIRLPTPCNTNSTTALPITRTRFNDFTTHARHPLPDPAHVIPTRNHPTTTQSLPHPPSPSA